MTSFRLTATLTLLLLSSTKVTGHARGSTKNVPRFGAEIPAPRQLMEDDGGGNNGDGLVESRDCQSFDTLSPLIKNNGRTETACLTNSCGGGCCRIFSWMVCDELSEYPHLACICNENTATRDLTVPPTPSPTSSPTRTLRPTAAPTSAPTYLPTSAPTDLPTKVPSASPTRGPTASPAPIPPLTAPPTTSPSASPAETPPDATTAPPTPTPSVSPTAQPTPAPSDATTAPPTPAPSDAPTVPPYSTEDTTNDLGEAVRSSKCLVPPKLQFIETATYHYVYEVYISAGVSSSSTVETFLNNQIHDTVAAKFLRCLFQEDDLWIIQSEPHVVNTDTTTGTTSSCRGEPLPGEQCFVVAAKDTIWIYDDPATRRRNLQNSPNSVGIADFVDEITAFIKDSMAAGVFSGSATPISQILYVSGELNPKTTNSLTADPSEAPVTDSDSALPGKTSETNGVSAQNPTPQNEGPPTPGIVVLAVAAAAVFVVLALVLFRRKNRRQKQLDYLEKADLDLVQQATIIEEHVDLDSLPGDAVMIGTDDDDSMDPYTTSTPSRRSHRPPLYSQDELDQAIGDHRGINSRHTPSPSRHNRRYRSSDTVDL